jgi:3-deoxy-manno-octulosonate cytidylyltransferase (CMP-KDO synthetase)
MKEPLKLGIIPARYGSSRFPGKPLAVINGKPMIQRVYEQCQKSNLDRVVVATDHELIRAEVEKFGGEVVMTSENCRSGTERCREALKQLDIETGYVVNVQGDEPFINPEQISAVLGLLQKEQVSIATLRSPAQSKEEVKDPNRVKVVSNQEGKALYFSRSPIPYIRDHKGHPELPHFMHIGIYGFKTATLLALEGLEEKYLERAESLEQLGWMEHGYDIYTAITHERNISIDTPEDLAKIEKS